ncbi:NAD(P)-dependent dehydrogenase (short-subunit alcohol dehydrogenase family) [Bradyrhizobium japonicum]
MSGKSLAGRNALVTGGARGIGAAIAQALARAGASIMIADILEETGRASAAAIAKEDVATGFVQLPAGHFKFLRVWSVKFLHPRGRTRDC